MEGLGAGLLIVQDRISEGIDALKGGVAIRGDAANKWQAIWVYIFDDRRQKSKTED